MDKIRNLGIKEVKSIKKIKKVIEIPGVSIKEYKDLQNGVQGDTKGKNLDLVV